MYAHNSTKATDDHISARLALLTNYVAPYQVTLFRELQAKVDDLRLFLSTPMEPNRPWKPNWDGLQVTLQRNLTIHRIWQHPQGFSEPVALHLPYDTLPLLQRYQPDVVISAELGSRTFQSLVYRKWNRRSRIIAWVKVSEHTEQDRGWIREALRRWLLPNSDAVLVNGDSGAKYVARLGASEKTIFRVPQTTEASLFSPLPLSKSEEQAHRLLYVGQLVERKGLFPFLSMLSRWAENHAEASVQFWLVGDGPERKRLETLIIPENVKLHFWGDVAHEELGQFYAQAGILVLPTLADEWGIVVNEAMTAGLPILGSKYSQAVEELVLDNVTGWTFRPDQSNAVYAAIDRALSTSIERLEEMRVAARRRTEKLSPGFVAHRILEAVRFVCSTVGNSIESHPCPRKPRRADD